MQWQKRLVVLGPHTLRGRRWPPSALRPEAETSSRGLAIRITMVRSSGAPDSTSGLHTTARVRSKLPPSMGACAKGIALIAIVLGQGEEAGGFGGREAPVLPERSAFRRHEPEMRASTQSNASSRDPAPLLLRRLREPLAYRVR